MGFTSSGGGAAVDDDTIKENSAGKIYVNRTDGDDLITEHEIEIIELQANAAVSPLDHDNFISETFSDETGYNGYVQPTPIAMYKCNDASGTTFTAEIGSDGTVSNASIWGTGKVDGGLVCANAYKGLIPALGELSEWSFCCWFKTTDNTADNRIMSTTGANRYIRIVPSDTKIGVRMDAETSEFEFGAAFANDTWYHLVVTSEGANLRCYINGIESSTGATANSQVLPDVDLNISYNWNAIPYFSGSIDDVRMYDKALPDIGLALYNEGTGTEETPSTDATFSTNKYTRTSGDMVIDILLPTISGEVTHMQLIVNDPDRETGDSITYDLMDTDLSTDTGQAVETQNALVNCDGTKLSGGHVLINLVEKSGGGTSGYPSIRSICLKIWKA